MNKKGYFLLTICFLLLLMILSIIIIFSYISDNKFKEIQIRPQEINKIIISLPNSHTFYFLKNKYSHNYIFRYDSKLININSISSLADSINFLLRKAESRTLKNYFRETFFPSTKTIVITILFNNHQLMRLKIYCIRNNCKLEVFGHQGLKLKKVVYDLKSEAVRPFFSTLNYYFIKLKKES